MAGLNVSPKIQALKKQWSGEKESSVAAREAQEKPPLSPTDGRVLRGKGKSIALNFRVTEEFKQSFYDAAKRDERTMSEILELAFAEYEKKYGGKR